MAMEDENVYLAQEPCGNISVQHHEPASVDHDNRADELIGRRPNALMLLPLDNWEQVRRLYSIRLARLPMDDPLYGEAATMELTFFHEAEEQTHNCGLYSWDYRIDGVPVVTEPMDWSDYTEDGQVPPLAEGLPIPYFCRVRTNVSNVSSMLYRRDNEDEDLD